MFLPVLAVLGPSNADNDDEHQGEECHHKVHQDDDGQVVEEAWVVDGIGVGVFERDDRNVAARPPGLSEVVVSVVGLVVVLLVVVGLVVVVRVVGLVVFGQEGSRDADAEAQGPGQA